MAQLRSPANGDARTDVAEVRITVLGGPARTGVESANDTAAGRWRRCAAVVLAVAAASTLAAVALTRPRASAPHLRASHVVLNRPAFGYPARCLSVTILPDHPTYAIAHVGGGGACAEYSGYVRATFHRVNGTWRELPRGAGVECPASIPLPVRVELGTCSVGPGRLAITRKFAVRVPASLRLSRCPRSHPGCSASHGWTGRPG